MKGGEAETPSRRRAEWVWGMAGVKVQLPGEGLGRGEGVATVFRSRPARQLPLLPRFATDACGVRGSLRGTVGRAAPLSPPVAWLYPRVVFVRPTCGLDRILRENGHEETSNSPQRVLVGFRSLTKGRLSMRGNTRRANAVGGDSRSVGRGVRVPL
jgi:hypothetical protein